MSINPRTAALSQAGVSIWLDDLSRERLVSGNLAYLIDNYNVVGVTTNPTIFYKALVEGDAYYDQLRRVDNDGGDADAFIRLATTDDVRQACDLLSPIFQRTNGIDGRVSIEVDPRLAYDISQTINHAQQLWQIIDRPNLLIKIPATHEGLQAITALLGQGISINATLIFSLQQYRAVLDAYYAGLQCAYRCGYSLSQIHSVASVFISRIDTQVDSHLRAIGTDDALQLCGQAGIANARLIYSAFLQQCKSPIHQQCVLNGGHPQRPLWASTGVKDSSYPDTLYVTELVGRDTVNTMPEKTLYALADHGDITRDSLIGKDQQSYDVIDQLSSFGIDLHQICEYLECEGVKQFEQSWVQLHQHIHRSLSLGKI